MSDNPDSQNEPLKTEERVELINLETVLTDFKRQAVLGAKALLLIRLKKLYRETYHSFEAYCDARWQFSRAHANRICAWAEVIKNLSPNGDAPYPEIEAHARPLSPLPAEQQREAWQCFLESPDRTQRALERICFKIKQKQQSETENEPSIRLDEDRTVICADVIEGISQILDSSVNLVLTSPPYAERRDGHFDSPTEEEFPSWMAGVMAALKPKLAHDGSVLLVIRPHLHDGEISDYVLKTRLAIRAVGWHECEELIWVKPDAPPLGSMMRPRRCWESVLWFSPSRRPYIDLHACGTSSKRIGFHGSTRFEPGSVVHSIGDECREGTARISDVIEAKIATIEKGIDHPAVFPRRLAEQLIQTFSRPGDLVADVFSGSGQTLLAAQRLGRRYVGIDNSPEYVALTKRRLSEGRVASETTAA